MKNLNFLFLLLSGFLLDADAAPLEYGLEARGSAYFPVSDTYRHIYGTVGPAFALEGFGKIRNAVWGWTNLQWVPKQGNSIGQNDSTHINVLNWSIGLKFTWQFYKNYYPYLGIGPNLSAVWIHNHGHCVTSPSKIACGFVTKSGVYCVLTKHLYLNVFVDYLYQHVHFTKNANVGGVNLGTGLGYFF